MGGREKQGMKTAGMEKRRVNVLDLACGKGVVQLALAERYRGREIHYIGVDPLESSLAAALETGRKLPGFKAGYYCDWLNFSSPKRFAKTLKAASLGKRFNEIHLHLAPAPFWEGNPAGPTLLSAVGRYLKPGGRLYHAFETISPLLDFIPEPLNRSKKPVSVLYSHNRKRIARAAKASGLVLDKYGLRQALAGEKKAEFVAEFLQGDGISKTLAVFTKALGAVASSTKTAPKKEARWVTETGNQRAGERHMKLLRKYSTFARLADHFVILRKPKRPTGR